VNREPQLPNYSVTQLPNSIRSAPWLIAVIDIVSTIGIAGAVYLWLYGGPPAAVAVLALIGLLAIVGVVDAAVSRIALEADALRVVSLFSQKRYERRKIERVTWEKGSGSALQLTDGSWVKLPDLGRNSQSTSNTIRAWLKR
jgi:hypothetical protein